MKKKLLLISISFFWLSGAMAQGKWELKKNQNGIAIYTRTAAKGNIKELRVVCELNTTQDRLINTLQNIAGYSDWVYSNKKSEILKKTDAPSIIYYTQSKLPWPIKDRDLVIELNIKRSPDALAVEAKSLPSYLPDKAGYIRVPYSLALWKVTQAPGNNLKVDYVFSVDPGGSIPSWLINATLTVGPYNSFVKLREVLKEKEGK